MGDDRTHVSNSAASQPALRIGFWSAILATVLILTFNIAIALGANGAPTRLIAVGASILLALSFVILMASIHSCTPQEKRIWSHIGLSFAIVYAALLIWNYYLQLTVVRINPHLYSWLTMDFTRDTAFWSLETIGYALMGLAALFVLPTLSKSRIELAIRGCFVANAVFTVLGSVGYLLSGNPLHVLVLISLGVWAIAFPIVTTQPIEIVLPGRFAPVVGLRRQPLYACLETWSAKADHRPQAQEG